MHIEVDIEKDTEHMTSNNEPNDEAKSYIKIQIINYWVACLETIISFIWNDWIGPNSLFEDEKNLHLDLAKIQALKK